MADNGCCGCDDSGNTSGDSGCPKSPERMTNWRTEHTRLKLPEDNFAFPVGGERTDPYDCNCDPPTESCCLNMDDIPDTVYAYFFLDPQAPPLCRPQAGRVGDFHFYTPWSAWVPAGSNPPGLIHFMKDTGITPFDCFYPNIYDTVTVSTGSNFSGQISWDLKRILESIGGSLEEDQRYQDKFVIELKRDRTFDSSSLPQNVSAVRVIPDIGMTLGPEAFHYRDYYSTNQPPSGVVLGRVPNTDYMSPEDASHVQGYSHLQTRDCVPKMVWTGKGKTPGGREIQVLYFCDGVDSQGRNQFRTMIYHLDELPNLWGTFKERDFWNVFEKFRPIVGWWSYTQDRDWNRFLNYSTDYQQYYLDPSLDYRVLQNPFYMLTTGYDWVDQYTWNVITAQSNTCYNLYNEYCSRRGYYYTPNMSIQLDGPFQATTIRQLPMFFQLNATGLYWPLDAEGNEQHVDDDRSGSPRYVPKHWISRVEYPCNNGARSSSLPQPNAWNDYYDDVCLKYNIQPEDGYIYSNSNAANQWWPYYAWCEWKFSKGPFLATQYQGAYQYKSVASLLDIESGVFDKFPYSWTISHFRELGFNAYVACNRRTSFPYGVLYPDKVPLLHKLFGNKHCPYTTPSAFTDFQSVGHRTFPLYFSVNGSPSTQNAWVEALVYKPYYPPPLYKMDIRLHKDDLPVEQDAHRAKLYCPALPGNGIENVPDRFPPDFKFPDGIYPKHLFVSIDQDFQQATSRNCMKISYMADESSGSPQWHYPAIGAVGAPAIQVDTVENCKLPSGVHFHNPKPIRQEYTNLFYRLDFVGLGESDDPNNITLNYGSRWTPDGVINSRYYYNIPSNILWLSDPLNNFGDLSVTLQIKSSDSKYINSITVGSNQENLGMSLVFPANPNHFFTNQNTKCPYVEVPMIRFYASQSSNYSSFPNYTPLLEFSALDKNMYSPSVHITSTTWDFRPIVTHHSADWSNVGGWGYANVGFNDPYCGTYADAIVQESAANGVAGGPCKIRGNYSPNLITPPGLPGLRFPNPNDLASGFPSADLYFCSDEDLQAFFLEGKAYWPLSLSPFPKLATPSGWNDGSGQSEIKLNYLESYAVKGNYPFRLLQNSFGSFGCGVPSGLVSMGDGTHPTDFRIGSTLAVDEIHTVGNFPRYSNFIEDSYETPYQKIWEGNEQVCVKAPNFSYYFHAYNSQAALEERMTDQLDVFVRYYTYNPPHCPYDTEGSMPGLNYWKTYTYSTGEWEFATGTALNCDQEEYTFQYKVLKPNIEVSVDTGGKIPGITIPRYVYPYAYFFKAIISA